jgi:hypothetical protein
VNVRKSEECEGLSIRWLEAIHLKRTLWAVTLSLPLSFVAFAISDNAQCPAMLRNILSPGILLANLQPAFVGGEGGNIGRFVVVTFTADAAYYTVILWFLFMAFRMFLDA